MTLKLDWCSYEAAKWACEHWHYSRVMPAGKCVNIGVWEDGTFVGCVIFGRGANNHIGSPWGLGQESVCELTRIAMTRHETPVSQVIAQAVMMLRSQSPGVLLIVSMADPEQGHRGVVYQAAGWLYMGATKPQRECIAAGKIMHKRSVNSRWGTIIGIMPGPLRWKHKYILPLTRKLRRQLEPLAKPYPKKGDAEEGSRAIRLSTRQEGQGRSLHSAPIPQSTLAEG